MTAWTEGESPVPAVSETRSAVQKAKASLMPDTAEGKYLARIGMNYGIPSPELAPGDDDMYRRIIMLLAWLPKGTPFCFYKFMEILFGSQDDLVTASLRPWRIYEVIDNEVVIEVPYHLIATTNENASYLHGVSGIGSVSGGNTHFLIPDDLTGVAVDLAGLFLYVWDGTAWEEAEINAVASMGPGLTDLVLSLPLVTSLQNTPYFIDIPGDEVSSFRGDYLAPDANEHADVTTPGSETAGHADRVYLTGDGKMEIFNQYLLKIARGAGIKVRIEKI